MKDIIKILHNLDWERRLCISAIKRHLDNKLIKNETLRQNKIIAEIIKHESLIMKLSKYDIKEKKWIRTTEKK